MDQTDSIHQLEICSGETCAEFLRILLEIERAKHF